MRKIDTQNFQFATRTTPKEINRQIVLNLVREHQPISRAELARRMNVARGMVTSLVNELLENGLIYEGATGSVPRGRKPTPLYIRSHDRLAVAVDVRISATSMMLSDFGGRELTRDSFPTPASPEDLVTELQARVQQLRRVHASAGCFEGIGLVVPGTLDRKTGRLLNAPALGWRDVDLRSPLAAGTGLPVQIERDAIACALAQLWLGRRPGDELDSFVYVTVSDGVGAGLVLNGMVVRGHRGTAGEFGHIPLELNGPLCVCGSRGCWEAFASNPATLARYLGRTLDSREAYAELRASGLSVRELVHRAGAGDHRARDTLEVSAHYLGVGLAGIINAYSPARIIVGGDIAGAWSLVGHAARAAIAGRALTEYAATTPITPEPLDECTRLRGATALVVAPMFEAPRIV